MSEHHLLQQVWIIKCDGKQSALMPSGYYWRYADTEDIADLAAGRVPKRIHVSGYYGPFISEDAAKADSERAFREAMQKLIGNLRN